ncbi:MAG TPA: amidohydrolase family protein [Bacteroidota bacterium]|nr:amidohydrolase family protein [Bacteroidota bacterium]
MDKGKPMDERIKTPPDRVMKVSLILLALIATAALAQRPLVVTGGTLIDCTGSAPVENSVVVIRGGKIDSFGVSGNIRIPDSAQVIDARGKYIIPGLIDCHIHYDSPRDLVQLLAWGVTAVNCMFESTDQALQLEKQTSGDSVHSAQFHGTAPIFTAVNGWWYGPGFPIDSTINRFPITPDDAREQVAKAGLKHLDKIKIMYDDMSWCRNPLAPLTRMDKNILNAIMAAAEHRNMVTEVHAPLFRDAMDVLSAACPLLPKRSPIVFPLDCFAFAHGIVDEEVDSAFTSGMADTRGWYIPTFCVFEFLAGVKGFMEHALSDERFRAALPAKLLEEYSSENYYKRYRERYPNVEFVNSHLKVLQHNMMTLHKRGIRIAMGTDMWAFPGIGAHLELEYMVESGMTPMDALRCATQRGIEFLGGVPVGTIEDNNRADILILDRNPLTDIRNTRTIRTVIKHGVVFEHAALVEESNR